MFGVKDTLTCLEMGAVETLIVWENFDVNRYVVLKPNGAPLSWLKRTSKPMEAGRNLTAPLHGSPAQ